uniref:Uncharacterized protein n=1 Tax=Anguilla anguilla TaxID=7936 RepID=A0A0E9S0F6_ANGAN
MFQLNPTPSRKHVYRTPTEQVPAGLALSVVVSDVA